MTRTELSTSAQPQAATMAAILAGRTPVYFGVRGEA